MISCPSNLCRKESTEFVVLNTQVQDDWQNHLNETIAAADPDHVQIQNFSPEWLHPTRAARLNASIAFEVKMEKADGDFEKQMNQHGAQGFGTGLVVGRSKYNGEFQNGQKHGRGVMICSDGSKYEGQFHEGEFHGEGSFVCPAGSRYVGQYVNGQKEGKGTLTHPDGGKHEGSWKEGLKHGPGVHTCKEGVVTHGHWEFDEVIH
eukprot:gnl/MRDRNA2_/MRDRNA2_15872_c0_seq1.p1 gnl/MRDRNA2_/MRDRNA2_15872_c0~~gnl/MRDRNA2_/MRDRNA2_15872_c0_seq1.p1  ORF type:complete len:205 (+),score=34.55 gnl/MRDRNA2_/MRDRNA2_15872_c0_seq1:71-685(+)